MDQLTKIENTPMSQLTKDELLILCNAQISEIEKLKFENWNMRMHYGPDIKKFKDENIELKRELEELKEVQ